MVLELTDSDFKEKTKKGKFIVDFWATWCGPCMMMAPVFEKVSEDFKGRITFAKVNVEENEAIPNEFGVSSIPTLVILKDGKEVDRLSGAMPEDALKQKVEEIAG